MADVDELWVVLVVVREGVRWSVHVAGEVVVVRVTQVVRDGQVEVAVLMQWNVLVLLCCLLRCL